MASKRTAEHTEREKAASAPKPNKKKPSPPKVSNCGCKGNCGSRRCGCVKKGAACGDSCKCTTDCKNPFNILKEYNIDCAAAAMDECLMDNIFKIEDLRGCLEKEYLVYCCEASVQLKDMIPGYVKCPVPGCFGESRFSWCRKDSFQSCCRGMKHCEKCRDCVDDGDRHCDDCNTCYFEGMSCFRCPCKGPDETGLYPDHVGILHPVEAMAIAREMLGELRADGFTYEDSDLSESEDLDSDSSGDEDFL
ncbi:KIF4B [Branchiostoma lanceolatum]|uniref:KIF4B protein n=1 Tax=Branchiostoma lanceolatum TaxID=7740 RepID=A0A8K0F3E5_BRALA|nr:KIF4B [Branchiostoma lanceolatum]